jgi:hypothetical protein
MKPANLGLSIASLAFAASTIYLAVQLREERARAAQFTEESQALQARIAELEKARAQFSEARRTADSVVPEDAANLPAAIEEQP